MNEVSISNGFLVIHVENRFTYDIELTRIKTPLDIVKWIVHLSQKNWCDRRTINYFANVAMHHLGLDPYEF